MAKIPEYFNIGNRNNINTERLLEIVEDMYKQLALAINKKPDLYQRTTDGQVTDTFLSTGDININENTQQVETLVDRDATTVTWKTL